MGPAESQAADLKNSPSIWVRCQRFFYRLCEGRKVQKLSRNKKHGLLKILSKNATIYVFFLDCEVFDISLVRNLLDKFHNCF